MQMLRNIFKMSRQDIDKKASVIFQNSEVFPYIKIVVRKLI